MQIEYCESCQKRITDHDFTVGLAAWMDEQVFCKSCMDRKGLSIPFPIPSVLGTRKSSSGRLSAIPGSGIRKSSSGRLSAIPGSGIRQGVSNSGVRKASPGGGVPRASSDSGIRKAPGVGSGLHNSSSLGSGVRKGKSTSGLHVVRRSGIQPAHVSTPSRVSGRTKMGRLKRRLVGRHLARESSTLWLSLLTGLSILLLVAGIYFKFLR